MVDTSEQSDQAPNPNEKSEICYCSALPNGSGPCLPCYTRWLAGSAASLRATKGEPAVPLAAHSRSFRGKSMPGENLE
jgi:hypothetical protein